MIMKNKKYLKLSILLIFVSLGILGIGGVWFNNTSWMMLLGSVSTILVIVAIFLPFLDYK